MRKHPVINDITTDFDKPPALMVKSQPENNPVYPLKFKEQQLKAYPFVKPREVAKGIQECMDAVKNWVNQDKLKKIVNLTGSEIYIVATTSLLRFKDDMVVEIRKLEGGDLQLHARSRSRIGRSDLGANAKRIQELFSYLEARQILRAES